MSCQQPLLSIWKTKPLPILLVPWTLEKGHVIQARLLDCLSWEALSIYNSRKNTWKPLGLGSSKGTVTWSVDSWQTPELVPTPVLPEAWGTVSLECVRAPESFLQSPYMLKWERISICCLQSMYLMWEVSVTQLCPTLWDPTDCSPAGSSVHGILQARILEWVAMPFSRGSSESRDQAWVSSVWSTREHGKKGADPSVEGKLALN